MGIKNIYYNAANITLFAFGITLFGISIFLFSASGFNTLSQAFMLTSFYYAFIAIYGLLTHRFERCNWYKYYSFGLCVLLFTQLASIIVLGFFYNSVFEYLQLIEGGTTYYVTEGAKFIQNSRVVWLVFLSFFVIGVSALLWIAWGFHKALYKQWIISEFKRLHGMEQDEGASKKNKHTQVGSSSANEPLIVNIE